jgi:hypothetical protein
MSEKRPRFVYSVPCCVPWEEHNAGEWDPFDIRKSRRLLFVLHTTEQARHDCGHPSSTAEIIADLQRFLDHMRAGLMINLTDLGYSIVPTAEIVDFADELAEEELLEETVSYRKNVTGVDKTIFISPKGKTRHSPRIGLAIDPAHTVDPQSETAAVTTADGAVVAGAVPPDLLKQVRRFIDANRDVLLDYWEYRIDTEELRQRLRPG